MLKYVLWDPGSHYLQCVHTGITVSSDVGYNPKATHTALVKPKETKPKLADIYVVKILEE